MSAWPKVSLGELLRLERRPVEVEAAKDYEEIGIYCFGRGIFRKRPRSGLEVGDKNLYLLKEGDFILQVTFAWEGAIAIVSKAEDGLYGSTRYPTFRVDETRCNPRFLLHYFQTHQGLEQIIRICPGSAGRNRVLSIKRIPEVMVPLPPLAEQRRVVARVEELAAQIHEARILRQQVSSEFAAMLRAIIRNGATTLTPMRALMSLRPPEIDVQRDQSYQFAGVYSFGRGVFKAALKSGADFAYPRLSRLRSGDFVYPKLMAWEGAFGITPPECDGCVVSTEFPVFEVNRERVLPEVLDVYFRDPAIWESVAGGSIGTNARRRRLNPADLLEYKFPLPSRDVQNQLAKVCAEQHALKRLQTETAAELDALLPAILDRAFKGELLPSERVDVAPREPVRRPTRVILKAQPYLLRFIPALLRVAGQPVSLDALNATVALLFIPREDLLPVLARLGGPPARAHFEDFEIAYQDGAFLSAVQMLLRTGTLTSGDEPSSRPTLGLGGNLPPITPEIEADARHLASLIGSVPREVVAPILPRLQPARVKETVLMPT